MVDFDYCVTSPAPQQEYDSLKRDGMRTASFAQHHTESKSEFFFPEHVGDEAKDSPSVEAAMEVMTSCEESVDHPYLRLQRLAASPSGTPLSALSCFSSSPVDHQIAPSLKSGAVQLGRAGAFLERLAEAETMQGLVVSAEANRDPPHLDLHFIAEPRGKLWPPTSGAKPSGHTAVVSTTTDITNGGIPSQAFAPIGSCNPEVKSTPWMSRMDQDDNSSFNSDCTTVSAGSEGVELSQSYDALNVAPGSSQVAVADAVLVIQRLDLDDCSSHGSDAAESSTGIGADLMMSYDSLGGSLPAAVRDMLTSSDALSSSTSHSSSISEAAAIDGKDASIKFSPLSFESEVRSAAGLPNEVKGPVGIARRSKDDSLYNVFDEARSANGPQSLAQPIVIAGGMCAHHEVATLVDIRGSSDDSWARPKPRCKTLTAEASEGHSVPPETIATEDRQDPAIKRATASNPYTGVRSQFKHVSRASLLQVSVGPSEFTNYDTSTDEGLTAEHSNGVSSGEDSVVAISTAPC